MISKLRKLVKKSCKSGKHINGNGRCVKKTTPKRKRTCQSHQVRRLTSGRCGKHCKPNQVWKKSRCAKRKIRLSSSVVRSSTRH